MQDKLITKVHNNARERREEVLRAAEQARTRAVVVLEEIGSLVVDETVPDGELRARIFAQRSSDDLAKVVSECLELRDRDDGSHLSFLTSWYGYTRRYSPVLLTTLNERLKSGDITVTDSRRWADFDDYLIPEEAWQRDRLQHYGLLGLPVESEEFIQRLSEHLSTITSEVDKRVPKNADWSFSEEALKATELDPKSCFTDTHGYTEVVMATAAMLGFELAPRIRDIKD